MPMHQDKNKWTNKQLKDFLILILRNTATRSNKTFPDSNTKVKMMF